MFVLIVSIFFWLIVCCSLVGSQVTIQCSELDDFYIVESNGCQLSSLTLLLTLHPPPLSPYCSHRYSSLEYGFRFALVPSFSKFNARVLRTRAKFLRIDFNMLFQKWNKSTKTCLRKKLNLLKMMKVDPKNRLRLEVPYLERNLL